jgi:hypothetical protein
MVSGRANRAAIVLQNRQLSMDFAADLPTSPSTVV